MTSIDYLPAKTCRHFIQGRCLLEERVNPGYHAGWRCALLLRLEEEFDKLLSQADNFSLEGETAARIWGGRMQGLSTLGVCPDFKPGGTDVTGCMFCLDGVCVRKLPRCQGACAKYEFWDGDD